MSHRISCYTLFDITKTGVLNRNRPGLEIKNIDQWFIKRSTQCNFDTILQVISLRAQPDVVLDPEEISMLLDKDSKFGFLYNDGKKHKVWRFDFEVQHASVFEDGIEEMGALYKDCDAVPMLKSGKEILNLNGHLSIDNSNRNIYFVKY